MKILLLERKLTRTGGSEGMVFAIARGLSERGHSMFLAYQSQGELLWQNQKVFQGCRMMPLQLFSWRSPVRTITTALSVVKLARLWNIDLILTSHRGFLRTLAVVQAISKVPFAYHLGLGPPEAAPSNRWAIKRMGVGIAPSQSTANLWIESGLPRQRVHVVSNWIDLERFKPGPGKSACKQKLGLATAAPTVVFVGRVVREKGVELLLRAFSRLSMKHKKDAVLVIVGHADNEYAQQLDALRRDLAIPKSKVLMTDCSNEPERYFAAADVTVVPSLTNESFGLTAIEAMACGTLVLVSSTGELPALLGTENHDLSFSSGDVDELRRLLELWIADLERAAKRGLALRKYVVKRFQAEDKINQYEHILDSITRPS